MTLIALTVVGARPQFVKISAFCRALSEVRREDGSPQVVSRVVHTGQHYDVEMSDVFFDELHLPVPDHFLNVGSGSHGEQTGLMLSRVERVIERERPDLVVVVGDTNSTLAGALAAAKLRVPVAHIEAGLRSGHRGMPEEVNRVLTDHVASLLFCPSALAVDNLRREGIGEGVYEVGDVMLDVLLSRLPSSEVRRELVTTLGLEDRGYALVTIHRPENADDVDRMGRILSALDRIGRQGLPSVFPVHPRTRRVLEDLPRPTGVKLLPPSGYSEMLALEASARVILTDSGGVQKEAYWLGVPCVTLRAETEWTETVELGWNVLADADVDSIVVAASRDRLVGLRPPVYGEVGAARRIAKVMVGWWQQGVDAPSQLVRGTA